MPDRSDETTMSALVRTTSVPDRLPPPWTAETMLVLEYWLNSGRLARLRAIPWDRPAQKYDLTDLVLVLLLTALSGAPGLRPFYREVDPSGPAFAAVWGRRRLPSRAQAAALFRSIPASVVAALDPFLSTSRAP